MADDEERTPERYEPEEPTIHEEAAAAEAPPPSREELAERHKRFSRPRKPMGPKPADERAPSPEEHGLPADIPATPTPEPSDAVA